MIKEQNSFFRLGNENWYDFGHIHVDNTGKGNKDWKTRKKYLQKLVQLFYELRTKLQDYPKEYQLWIMLDEHDSREDCVYLHTRNPNADNFPLKVPADNAVTIESKELREFVDLLDLEKVRIETSEGSIYFLFDKDTGISLA